jgi:chromate transporter
LGPAGAIIRAVTGPHSSRDGPSVSLGTVAREWTRIGVTGFGGPPAHIALLRALMVDRTGWMTADEFQDANAACSLLPGPASTQMAMFCAYRVAGIPGVLIGGFGFIAPAVVLIIALSLLFLAHSPPLWVRGAGAGAGGAVAAVAVQAGRGFIAPSLARAGDDRARRARWAAYLLAGLAGAVLAGPYLVLVLLGCGAGEVLVRRASPAAPTFALLIPGAVAGGGLGALAWTALKVGALSFGGGFVIIPLMQGDAVHVHHWMTSAQFLNAVALGQVTPGPVVATVAAVGYAAHGIGGALLAAGVAFAPSFSFILLGGPRFGQLRANRTAQAFLDGAGPAAIGAIFGAAILLALALRTWQFAILGLAGVALLVARRGVVSTLLGAGAVGVVVALAGVALPS